MKKLVFGLAFFAGVWCLLPAAHADSAVAADQRRGVEQTFLTFPEWFLVHSPAEYATLVATAPPHRFPFARHVMQMWSSYFRVIQEQARQKYPTNAGYHVMIVVISTSTTAEYLLRWVYENSFGRLSWLFASGLTEEDRYGARVAQQYVDFIRKEPWYLFDFQSKLEGLWTDTPLTGQDILRKWERRYALTTEYLVKASYAWLIEKATQAAYDPALMTTQVVTDRVPSTLPQGATVVRALPDGRAVLDLPRYFGFRIAATELAQEDVHLLDVAGNTSVILVTVWCPAGVAADSFGPRVLFEQPLLTTPWLKRVALVIPVPELSKFLANAPQRQLSVEHVYDY